MAKRHGLKFIDIRHIPTKSNPTRNYCSCFLVNEDGLEAVGVISHYDKIIPKTIKDAEALVRWLNKWIANRRKSRKQNNEKEG